jgi:serine/threonine-protein kinase
MTGGADDSGKIEGLDRTVPSRRGAIEEVTPPTQAKAALGSEATGKIPVGSDGTSGLARYQILEEVGQGGMAIVYRARDLVLDREVAVKVLHAHLAGQAESRDRLEREAQAVAKLRHENILEIFDYSGRGSEKAFIVTEFIHGTTLRAFMQTHASVLAKHPEIAELVICEVARALEHAHKAGVIHRDVKPENVMIRNDGVIKLTDFGIAQMIDKERMTVTGQLLGSPAYMAPEHVEGGGIDFRTDVFAVGILLYQLATGKLPFRGKNPHEVLKRIGECVYAPPDTVNPRVGRKLGAVIARAMAKDKEARYGDVGDLRRELVEDLADAGLEDPRAELTRLFMAPVPYAESLGPRIVAGLTARGQALRTAGRRAAALELWRRALEIAPNSGELHSLVAGAERQRRIGRSLALLLGIAALGTGGAAGVRAWRKHLAEAPRPTPPVSMPAPPHLTTTATTTPTGMTTVPLDAHPHPRDRPRPVMTGVTPEVRPLRRFELVPTPKAVRVLLDDKLLGDFGPQLQSVELDGQPHSITFDSPFCYPETIPIGPNTEPGRISRRLKWKPATLTVESEPEEADILIDGNLVVRSGRAVAVPLDPLSDGKRVLRVKVSAAGHLSEEREVTLRANGAEKAHFTLKAATGTP